MEETERNYRFFSILFTLFSAPDLILIILSAMAVAHTETHTRTHNKKRKLIQRNAAAIVRVACRFKYC